MSTGQYLVRRFFSIILIVGIVAGVGVAHCVYYLKAKADIAKEIARHPETTEADYHILYRNLAHSQTLVYGAIGGAIAGAILGWSVDAIRMRRAARRYAAKQAAAAAESKPQQSS
jgi:hypothetical protein